MSEKFHPQELRERFLQAARTMAEKYVRTHHAGLEDESFKTLVEKRADAIVRDHDRMQQELMAQSNLTEPDASFTEMLIFSLEEGEAIRVVAEAITEGYPVKAKQAPDGGVTISLVLQ